MRIIRLIIRVFAILTGFIILAGAGFFALFMYLNSPPAMDIQSPKSTEGIQIESNGTVTLEVKRGEAAISVGKRLEESGLIRSWILWNIIARLDKEHIKSGRYRIDGHPTQLELRSILVEGKQLLVRVTIPEGVSLKKSASILDSTGIVSAEDFLQAAHNQELLSEYAIPAASFEGYLYPDTYFFPHEYPAEQVIKTMADTFFKKIEAIHKNASELSAEELFERVVIASIVEREYRVSDEAALMAGVFYNRLRIGMALQSCATVQYVITDILDRPHPEVLYNRDLEIESPYNTYIRAGLPPGPISNPGAVSLHAAFNPMPSNYLYFRLVDPAEGRHRFSKTLDDHIQAGILYIKGSAAYQ